MSFTDSMELGCGLIGFVGLYIGILDGLRRRRASRFCFPRRDRR